MHESLEKVLTTRDLAKAGDLFSVPDDELANDCSSAIALIGQIVSQEDYVQNDGVQAVVEICVTRIICAIRETDAIEAHIQSLVELLRKCLRFEMLSDSQGTKKQSPHAKIVSDILSCIYQNYCKPVVMEMAAPITVLYLDKENEELTRNVTSYLNLAVINHQHLVAPHVDCVIRSIYKGNNALIKLLPALADAGIEYFYQKPRNVDGLVKLLSKDLNEEEMNTILSILVKACSKKPKIMEPHLACLADHLTNREFSEKVITIFELVARESAHSCLDYKEQVMEVAKSYPTTAPNVARIMGSIGSHNEKEAEECIDYLGNQLNSADTSYLPVLLQQLLHIGTKFPDLLKIHMINVASIGESKEVEVKRLVRRLIELVDMKNSGSSNSITDQSGSLPKNAHNLKTQSLDSQVKSKLYSYRSTSQASHLSSEQPQPTQELPYPDALHQFCIRHMGTIKNYMETLSSVVPLPYKCTVEEEKKKKYRYIRLYFGCHKKENDCLYRSEYFTMRSKYPKLWIHLMFLNLQAKSTAVLKQQDSAVDRLSMCWQCLQVERSDTFLRLVTSSFPTSKEIQLLSRELWGARFFDVISLEPMAKQWCCFMCNNPDKLSGFIKADGTPRLTGQLKEKKGKWKLFKRWKKRYFTLSGDNITYQKTGNKLQTLNVSQIESVRACRKKPRDTPRAFEIFTEDGSSYKFKSDDHKSVERWVQCLNLAMAKNKKSGKYHTVS